MGGPGSGRKSQRASVEDGLTLSLPKLLRDGAICLDRRGQGALRFRMAGERVASVGYRYDLTDPHHAWLKLRYHRSLPSGHWLKVEQRVPLVFTEPNYGGRRWWMVCPYGGHRVLKLYLPPGGDTFASRADWRL